MTKPNNKGSKALGYILLVIGITMLVHNLGINIGFLWGYSWPIIIIGLGGLAFYYDESRYGPMGPSLIILLGCNILLSKLGLIGIHWHPFILPIIVITIAIKLLEQDIAPNNANKIAIFNLLGGNTRSYDSPELVKGNISTFLGSVKINLQDADLKDQQQVLSIVTLFGGVELNVPNHWRIENEALPILCNIKDETQVLTDKIGLPQKTLRIQGLCIFGGIRTTN